MLTPPPSPSAAKNKKRGPLLVQFNVRHAGMALGCSAYSSLLRTLVNFGVLPSAVATVAWCFACVVSITIFTLLLVRTIKYPHLLVHDLDCPERTPFFTAPAIFAGTLASASPPMLRRESILQGAFLVLLLYQTAFALFWYGRWVFSNRHTLRNVRATYFMATTEFFVLGYLGAISGFRDLGRISLSIGMLFWAVILVAYFHFRSTALLNDKLNPTMFLLIAPPAATAISHMELTKTVDGLVTMDDFTWFFVSITLFFYLLCFRLFREYWNGHFAASWWAYIFPLSTAANLAARVADVLKTRLVWSIAGIAAVIATIMLTIVTCLTVRAIIQGNYPKDEMAIRVNFEKQTGQLPLGIKTPRSSEELNCGIILSEKDCDEAVALAYLKKRKTFVRLFSTLSRLQHQKPGDTIIEMV